MPEYIETGVMDGYFTWITVNYSDGESKRVAGLVAEKFGPEDFIIIYDALMKAQEIPADLTQQANDVLRVSIFPTGTTSESYYFELNSEGVLFGTVGVRASDDISEQPFLVGIDDSLTAELSTSDYNLLLNLCVELEESGFDFPKELWCDSWDVGLIYNGKVYETNYWSIDDTGVFKTRIKG